MSWDYEHVMSIFSMISSCMFMCFHKCFKYFHVFSCILFICISDFSLIFGCFYVMSLMLMHLHWFSLISLFFTGKEGRVDLTFINFQHVSVIRTVDFWAPGGWPKTETFVKYWRKWSQSVIHSSNFLLFEVFFSFLVPLDAFLWFSVETHFQMIF